MTLRFDFATLLTAVRNEAERVRVFGHALDRPVIEALVRGIARGKKLDLASKSREELVHAALAFALKDKAVKKELSQAVIEATRLERAKLGQLDDAGWQAALAPHLSQRRSSAKFIVAMAVRAAEGEEHWLARIEQVLEGLRQDAAERTELMQKAEAAGIGASLKTLEESRGGLEAQVQALEVERARINRELADKDSALAHAKGESALLKRELLKKKDHAPKDTREQEQLKKKLQKAEKAARFAEERAQDREMLRLVEDERDVLAKEVALLRVQLQLAQLAVMQPIGVPPPERVVIQRAPAIPAPSAGRRNALYVDGANVAGAARLLYDRKVDFLRLKEHLLGHDNSADLHAYVVEGAGEGFAAFVRALKRGGYAVHKRAPKRLPDGSMKADLDVHLAVDLMAARGHYQRVVLCSGDSDFVPLVKKLKQEGIRVEAAAFRARAAQELIACVDAFIPLDEKVLS